MTVDAIGQAATLGSGLGAMSSEDFLHLFAAQLEYQDPTAPMTNAEMMQQLSQLTQLQAVSELKSGIESLMKNNALLQASGLIGHTIEYAGQSGLLTQSTVIDVQLGDSGDVLLGLKDGSKIGMDVVHRVM